MKRLALLLVFFSCAREPVVTEKVYAGQWLQLDRYFPDSCFELNEENHLVYVFDDGEEEQTLKEDWNWSFDGVDTYTFNDEINLYVSPSEDDCWNMIVWEVSVQACPCQLPIPTRNE